MKKTKERVKQILTENVEARDKQGVLCYLYYCGWCNLFWGTTIEVLFHQIDNKQIPSIQTLMRFSRQLQEKNPELQGKEWTKRKKLVKPVQKDLGYNVK